MAMRKIPPMKLFFPQKDIAYIKSDLQKILESGMLTLGEYTRRFENEYAKVCGVKHGVAVNSGTSALEIALRSLGLKKEMKYWFPRIHSPQQQARYFSLGKACINRHRLKHFVHRFPKCPKILDAKNKGRNSGSYRWINLPRYQSN